MKPFRLQAEVLKVDESLGLVLGWGIVCTEKGEPYFDLQGDHIPEESMIKAVTDFMTHSRVAREMHSGGEAGTVLYSFPLTKDVKDAFGIECDRTGWMVGVQPNPEMLGKFKRGELKGFSIGGKRVKDEEVR